MSITSLDLIAARDLKPTLAILFHHDRDRLALVTAHRVLAGKKGAALDAGRPLGADDEQQILALLDGKAADREMRGWVPSGLLAESGTAVLWFVPGAVRTLLMRDGDAGAVPITVQTPNLVFGLNRKQRLSVCAVANADRPGPDTPVYHAPLPNIYADGTVCYGSSTLPVKEGRAAIDEWNAMFFTNSAFTHANHPHWLAGQVGRDAAGWWRQHASKPAGKRAFPSKLLVPVGATLAQWWSP